MCIFGIGVEFYQVMVGVGVFIGGNVFGDDGVGCVFVYVNYFGVGVGLLEVVG